MDIKRIKKTKYCLGDLKHKIQFVKRVEDKFDGDAIQKNWIFEKAFTMWAGNKSTNGVKFISGIAVQDGSTDIFITRYKKEITSELFIEFQDLRFKILNVKNLGRNKDYMEITCQELGSDDLKGTEK